MKTVFVNSIQHFCEDECISERLKKCYTNTGNFVWHDCCKKEIDYDYEVDLFNLPKGIEDSNLVVAADNTLSPYESLFSKRLRRLLECKTQITLIGLGAQANKELNTPKKLVKAIPKSKIRLFEEIADRSVSIGVRGEFTADCLKCMGIHNYQVIGCPSFYSSVLSNDNVMALAKIRKISINITGGGKCDHKLLELIFKYGVNSKLILQGKWDMAEVSHEGKKMTTQMLERGLPNISIKRSLLENYWKKNAQIFFDLNEWKEYIQKEKFTFSLGTRLHGNMIHFLMGVPALWITHDSRTQEIAELLKLPYMTDKEFLKKRYVEEVMEKCVYGDDFYENYNR